MRWRASSATPRRPSGLCRAAALPEWQAVLHRRLQGARGAGVVDFSAGGGRAERGGGAGGPTGEPTAPCAEADGASAADCGCRRAHRGCAARWRRSGGARGARPPRLMPIGTSRLSVKCVSHSLCMLAVWARDIHLEISCQKISRGSGPHTCGAGGASRERRAQERGVKAMSNLGSARRTPRGHTRTLLNILTCMCNTRYRDTATPPGQRGYQMSRLTAESMASVLWPAIGSLDGRAEARLLRHRSGCLGLGLARGSGTGGG